MTKLIVKWYHENGNHVAGTNHTLSISKIKAISRTRGDKRMESSVINAKK